MHFTAPDASRLLAAMIIAPLSRCSRVRRESFHRLSSNAWLISVQAIPAHYAYCGVGNVSAWQCIRSKIRYRQPWWLSNFQILQATPWTSKVMANQFIPNNQKVPKKRCGMYGLSPFPSFSLYLSPQPPPPTVIFSSGMFGYKYIPLSSWTYLMRMTYFLSRNSRSYRCCRPALYSSSVWTSVSGDFHHWRLWKKCGKKLRWSGSLASIRAHSYDGCKPSCSRMSTRTLQGLRYYLFRPRHGKSTGSRTGLC